MKQCPTCGRVDRDWSQDGVVRNDLGGKIGSQDSPGFLEDRCAAYRRFRAMMNYGAVTDFDQIEWRSDGQGYLVPVALFELTRVDGNVPVSQNYLDKILDRILKRDQQGELAKRAASGLDMKAWIVAFRHDLSEFWVYNLSYERGWFHGDAKWFRGFIESLQCP